MATHVMGVTKTGNAVPRAGFEPTSLAFRASVIPLHHIGFPDVGVNVGGNVLVGMWF